MSPAHAVVTRFAPSPTGMLHIGGARTALFNWVFARSQGGRFLLRIEDTDRARSTPEACEAILEGLGWLGLDWDEEPVYQFARAGRHREIADALLQRGMAYRDYSTEEERAEQAAALKRGERAPSPWRDRRDEPADLPFVVRLKAPLTGETRIDDRVQGEVVFRNSELDDLVLLRSDGSPTYMLAVVVDDHDMGVTHIIRGDDHLTNAARQALIWDGMGWPRPVFAHIPLIHGADGKKLSKRHGAVGTTEFAAEGYLPEAMRNYLLRLGWAHGDMELFTDEEARTVFSLDGISKGAAQLDYAKLDSVNQWHIRALDPTDLLERCHPWLTDAYGETVAATDLLALVAALQERLTRLGDIVEQSRFVFQRRPLALDGKSAKPLKKTDPALFREAVARLAALPGEKWRADILQDALQSLAVERDVGFGALGGPLRAAVCAGAPAPDLGVTLSLIGRDETLARLNDALTQLSPSSAS